MPKFLIILLVSFNCFAQQRDLHVQLQGLGCKNLAVKKERELYYDVIGRTYEADKNSLHAKIQAIKNRRV